MSTQLFIVRSQRRVEVFGDAVGQALILGKPLHQWQEEVAAAAGLEVAWVDAVPAQAQPHFVMEDDVFITDRALRAFVRRARTEGRNAVAGIASNAVWDRVAATHGATAVKGGNCYRLRYVCGAGQDTPVLLAQDDLAGLFLRLPRAISADGGTLLPHSSVSLLHIRTPLHIFQANMQANQAALWQRVPLLPSSRRKPPRLHGDSEALAKWNHLGAGCSIHPTAWVEGCAVGRGVTVGPYAVCLYSVLGDGAVILDGANITGSVVGSNTMVGQGYRVITSVVYPECFLTSGALQFSIMGARSAVYAAWVTDARMDHRSVSTVVDGEVVDSGMEFLGCILGHRARLTAGVITAPGRIIPNDGLVYPDPAQVLTQFPPGQPAGVPYILGKSR
jgi:bifunctional UDP-N-acetylglucosamine pyrophosphorylase/glucosamine-1-phosphate N-acetyltransferase